ncbi:hypothetical protein SUGI_0301980 [Cryptomeria japonica]|uniref:E3 ubiquitin-protein ligase DA2L n=1 Tax=Cryptomeria japonica TaxID=3369 RepID=UPI002408AE25|nr:E3 ubiquitin-protein ligase DA2L [Cryptomeria japonica]GLJ17383.1 hypothetical protein SUGI_0301980 [Cryptomeria japonica]
MGNKFTRRRHVVDERFTRPQGLYQHRDVDQKKLRKLILDGKLAPCYPGGEEHIGDLDECPICFLYYPSLNRSRCCMKGICTECFLQMKSPHSARPTQCPFCKTSNYAVEYRGCKTQEEKGIEQAEEQKVIEAKIRMQQEELQAEKERVQRRQEPIHGEQMMSPEEIERLDLTNPNAMSDEDVNSVCGTHGSSSEPNEVHATQSSSGVAVARPQDLQPLQGRQNRGEDGFDLDLEDIMIMEAIWLSLQEHGSHRIPGPCISGFESTIPRRLSEAPGLVESRGSTISNTVLGDSREATPNSSVTGGLACAIAALAERQILNVDSMAVRQRSESQRIDGDVTESGMIESQDVSQDSTSGQQDLSPSNICEQACDHLETDEHEQQAFPEEPVNNSELEDEREPEAHASENWIEVSPESGRALSQCLREGSRSSVSDWMFDHSSEVVEVGTSFSSSIPSASDLPWEAPDVPQNADVSADPPSLSAQPYVVPESYEEQMMLALAISLAEAQARS